MSGSRLALLLVFVGCMGGTHDPNGTSSLPDHVTCTGGSPGAACDVDGEWCRTTDQCGEDVRFCHCVGGQFACTEPYTSSDVETCTAIPDGLASCSLEGTGVCDQEPVGGGSCGCSDGTWACRNACDGCPTAAPTGGDACSTTNVCRYTGLQCTCTNGMFACVTG